MAAGMAMHPRAAKLTTADTSAGRASVADSAIVVLEAHTPAGAASAMAMANRVITARGIAARRMIFTSISRCSAASFLT
jgi:hypothetical protein